jgi:hypothetical protein
MTLNTIHTEFIRFFCPNQIYQQIPRRRVWKELAIHVHTHDNILASVLHTLHLRCIFIRDGRSSYRSGNRISRMRILTVTVTKLHIFYKRYRHKIQYLHAIWTNRSYECSHSSTLLTPNSCIRSSTDCSAISSKDSIK